MSSDVQSIPRGEVITMPNGCRVFRLLPCDVCGRHYPRTHEEMLAMTCCGKPQPRVDITTTADFGPRDLLADPQPLIVEPPRE